MRKYIGPCLLAGACLSAGAAAAQERPNIILIMADDMGYADLGCYGSEISTPNLDGLAFQGLRLTQFYNTARSCPTRASLLTGLNPHQAGIGWMVDRNLGYEGYAGDLNPQSVTLAQVLKTAGYHTYMSGKWHVVFGANARHKSEDKSNWPLQRGFDRFFGIVGGAAHYWKPVNISLDNEKYPHKPYFLTDMIGDYAAQFLDEHKAKETTDPFFLYLTFNAPHWPLHAREETIQRYVKFYEERGWDALREARYRKMVELGLIDPQWELTPRDSEAPAWDSLSAARKKDMARRMATYAAQIEEMDRAIGKVLKTLQQNRQDQNTLILFLSDNGACAEFISNGPERSTESIGRADSWESVRLPWANVSVTPFRLYKHWMHEGGISTPLIVNWDRLAGPKGRLDSTPASLIDIMATFVDLSGATYPGAPVPPMEGKSLVPVFKGGSLEERYIFLEHEANRMARKGKWKIVEKASIFWPFNKAWELYDMEADRTELHNLAAQHPHIVAEMAAAWDHWAQTHKVLPLDGREHGVRTRNTLFHFPQE